MTERPILFSTSMVQAILAGRKTQTRRVAKHLDNTRDFIYRDGIVWASLKPEELAPLDENPPRSVFGARAIFDGDVAYTPIVVGAGDGHHRRCPFGDIGDWLWVREAWGISAKVSTDCHREWILDRVWLPEYFAFRADSPPGNWCWRPSIHMPRWASRLTLEITDVRLQRLQRITEKDAEAEGAEYKQLLPGEVIAGWTEHKLGFAFLWDQINAKRGYGWDANPWVWCVNFRRVE